MRATDASTSFDRHLWAVCDKPAYCDLTRGEPTGDCSCTGKTGCTYLGRAATGGPCFSNAQSQRVEQGR